MAEIYQAPLTAQQIKAKARELGADLVGIADGKMIEEHPPEPSDPRRPSDITDYDGDRVIVMAKKYTSGTTRILPWNDRHKYYNDELTLTLLEEASLELVYWLEDKGYPSVIIPPTHVDPWRYQDQPEEHQKTLLSLTHAAVEAGLGTLGLNLQLLTPEYGPRVILTAVLCSVDCEADRRVEEALCLGPECGRCLETCPGDVVQHWNRDWEACDRYRSPHGFAQLTDHLVNILDETDVAKQKEMIRSEESFNLWQSILRGAGVITGCRRCQDVCPVGEDYAALEDALEEIPESTPEKKKRLLEMLDIEKKEIPPGAYQAQRRWIGEVTYRKPWPKTFDV